MTQHFGGTAGKVLSEKTCVVYDSQSGRIHHVHHTVTLKGGQESTEVEIEARALSQLSQRGIKGDYLTTVHVESDAMEPGNIYKIDPQTRSLVIKGERKKLARA